MSPHPDHQKLLSAFDYNRETGVFTRLSDGRKVWSLNNCGYVQIYALGRVQSAARLAWFYAYGEWPKNTVDHRDRNKTNNAILNLREANRREQQYNVCQLSNTKSGHRGITRTGKLWIAHISVLGARKEIGRYAILERAIAARRIALSKLAKEFSPA